MMIIIIIIISNIIITDNYFNLKICGRRFSISGPDMESPLSQDHTTEIVYVMKIHAEAHIKGMSNLL